MSDSIEPQNVAGGPEQPSPPYSLARIKAYHKTKRALYIADLFVSLACWLVWCALAGTLTQRLDQYIEHRWLGLFAAAAAMLGTGILIGLPLDFYSSYVHEHRYGLSNQTLWAWFIFQLKSWLVGLVLGGAVLAGLYAALWYGGRLWGVYVWCGVMLLSIVLAKLFPLVILPLFYPAKPLERPALSERLKALAGGAGMTITGIFDLALSKDTKKANAMLAGLGSTRRVYLSDTLLQSFDDNQIAVVFAHELGHHVRRHMFKQIAIAAVVTSLLVALIWWRLNPYAGGAPAAWAGPVAALAEVMLISTVFPLLIGPLTNALSRHFERQADRDALRLTDDARAFRTAFEKLIQLNLADPDPPRWEEILFDDHPALSKRIALAEAYGRAEHAQRHT